jgi:hypothetical protein
MPETHKLYAITRSLYSVKFFSAIKRVLLHKKRQQRPIV